MTGSDNYGDPEPVPAPPTLEPGPSVWATAQSTPAVQRKGRYVPASTAHPAKMLPAIAAHAIATYTRPGDLVLDPMCGIGTTLIEAVHQGRHAVGVEYEPRWAAIAQANLDLARDQGATGAGQVITGDARRLPKLLSDDLRGRAALVITSPPYGPSTHGQVNPIPGHGVRKRDFAYGSTRDRRNLANLNHRRLLSGLTDILTGCAAYLRPGGHIVITIRPWREHGQLINLPAHVLDCGTQAGLVPVERCVALLARITSDQRLVARGSFFQRNLVHRQRAAGHPVHLITHEDVVILQTPPICRSSRERKPAQAELNQSSPSPPATHARARAETEWLAA